MDGISPVGSPAFPYAPQSTTPVVAQLAGPTSAADQVILSSASLYAALGNLGESALYSPTGQTATPAAAPAGVPLVASPGTDPALGGLFAASSTFNLVNAEGAAALSYITPATPPLGTNIDALA